MNSYFDEYIRLDFAIVVVFDGSLPLYLYNSKVYKFLDDLIHDIKQELLDPDNAPPCDDGL